jgi:hypothetical protein
MSSALPRPALCAAAATAGAAQGTQQRRGAERQGVEHAQPWAARALLGKISKGSGLGQCFLGRPARPGL